MASPRGVRSEAPPLRYGTRLTAEVRANVAADADGTRRMIAVVRNVSTRERAEILQRALYRIAETSASATDLKGLCAALHQIVGELTYARNFRIALAQEDGSLLYPFYVDEHSPPPGKRPPIQVFGPWPGNARPPERSFGSSVSALPVSAFPELEVLGGVDVEGALARHC